MGEHKLLYLLTYLLTFMLLSISFSMNKVYYKNWGIFNNFSDKYLVKFGHFVNFRTQFSFKNVLPRKVDWAPAPMNDAVDSRRVWRSLLTSWISVVSSHISDASIAVRSSLKWGRQPYANCCLKPGVCLHLGRFFYHFCLLHLRTASVCSI